ncbi:hypothetical protein LCGC14_1237290 [marine sediment metagenome]|uniref:Plasmid stabilization system protein n=1 Tax=marine sediment metagenome TaxID=412755 RepID=A0A0F9L6Y3_9ZZZZ
MVEIEWSSIAQNDLNKIIDYIAQDSLEYALLFYEQVKEKVDNLTQFPKMGRKVPELVYFVGSSHNILNIPWENCISLRDAMIKHRNYPLN